MRHVERGPELGQTLLHLFGSLPIPFRCGRDAHRAQQFSGGPARIARFAEDRMQSFAGKMVKDEINDAPWVECLFVVARAVGVHAPEKTSAGPDWRSQLETVPGNLGFTL